jgi:hypothetical protein
MRPILVFAPYIFVPLFIAILFQKLKLSKKGLTFLLTFLLIFIYPYLLFWIDSFVNPPINPKCATPQTAFLIGNTFVFLPISLIIQFVLNKAILKIEKK